MPPYIKKARVIEEGFNRDAVLPYDLTVDDIKNTIKDTHEFLYEINKFLVSKNYERLEEFMLANAFAGFISEVIVRNLVKYSKKLGRNKKVGGYPDLIPRGKYPNDSVLRGKGVEVKASKQRGGWQGHNPEEGWIIIFRYETDVETEPKEKRSPTEIVEVLAAKLTRKDWSFSGRDESSRRTITASIVEKGMQKLRANRIYLKPRNHSIKKWM